MLLVEAVSGYLFPMPGAIVFRWCIPRHPFAFQPDLQLIPLGRRDYIFATYDPAVSLIRESLIGTVGPVLALGRLCHGQSCLNHSFSRHRGLSFRSARP